MVPDQTLEVHQPAGAQKSRHKRVGGSVSSKGSLQRCKNGQVAAPVRKETFKVSQRFRCSQKRGKFVIHGNISGDLKQVVHIGREKNAVDHSQDP